MLFAMAIAQEINQVAPGIFIWQVYDPAVKADLFSTALETPLGTYLVDPVDLDPGAMETLEERLRIAGIVVTNENHERATRRFAERFSVPVYLHEALAKTSPFQRAIELQDKEEIEPGLTAIALDGAPAGEIALHYEAGGGTMVVGDALINFEPHGFGLLPAKYCRDFKLMRRSLPRLLDYSFERMLFAHGTPILSGARARLEQLLAAKR
jgi:glyoxylase-like metal-dependent hydrolase (beta-lactamase superfamily II)